MAYVLVIEDEPDLQAVLGYNLRQAGHEVVVAGTAAAGLGRLAERRPELLLLDLMLPDLPGTEVLKRLRGEPRTRDLPILLLTAKGDEIDRVLGFELGADDYMTKPFSMRELLLRVQAILRRAAAPAGAPASPPEGTVTFGRLVIDKPAHRTFVDGQEVELTALEFRLLVHLLARKNRVQSREMLLEDVWEMDPSVSTRTVDTHVKRLREKLGPAADYIETVRGAGYRFADTPGE